MEEKKEELRELIDRLYRLVDWFGAYSPVATEIQNSCAGLTKSLEEYERLEKEMK